MADQIQRQEDSERLSSEVSLALDLLGYRTEMIRLRRIEYEKRINSINKSLSAVAKTYENSKFRIVGTGSKREGTSIWDNGDEDMMLVFNECIGLKDRKYSTSDKELLYFKLEDNNTTPGYTFVKPYDTKCLEKQSIANNIIFKSLIENDYLSSQRINKMFYDIFTNWLETLTQTASEERNASRISYVMRDDSDNPKTVLNLLIFEHHTVDIVPAGTCLYPEILSSWSKRERQHEWPPKDVINRILRMPFHVVPKGFQGSANRNQEFRICHTLGEIELMKSLSELQIKLYVSLKMVIKSGVETEVPDVITSYVLKNVLFWICEITSSSEFESRLLLQQLTKCLLWIRDHVINDYLPNYFMPARNMLEGKLNEENKDKLVALISDMVADGPIVIYRSLAITYALRIIRKDIVVAMAISFYRNTKEISMLTDTMSRVNTFKSVPLSVAMTSLYIYLVKVYGNRGDQEKDEEEGNCN